MRVRKLFVSLLTLIFTFSLILMGCGSSNTSTNNTSTSPSPSSGNSNQKADTGQQVTLKMWVSFTGAELDLLNKMIADYEKQNPNIKIDKFDIPYDQRGVKIQTAAQADDLPDIIRSDYPDNFELTKMGKLMDLRQPLEERKWDGLTDIPQFLWDAANLKGTLTAFPQDRFERVVFYNKKLFKEAGITEFPKTWDEFVEASKKLTKAPDHYAVAYVGNEYESFSYAAGATWFDDNGNIKINTPEWKKGLEFYVNNFTKDKILPPGTPNYGFGEQHQDWNSEKVAMIITGSWDVGNTKKDAPNIDFGVAPLPAGPKGKKVGLSAPFYAIPKQSKHQKEALDFLIWLNSKENVATWSKTLGHLPIRTSVANDPFFQTDIFKPMLESNDYAIPSPQIIRKRVIDKAFKDQLQALFLGKTTMDQALVEIQKAADEVNALEKQK